MKTKTLWIILGLALFFTLLLYFLYFNSIFSPNSQDWSAFGGYLSGVMMPILTAVNIWVFVKLTKVIDENNDNRQKDEVVRQMYQQKSERAFQKRKIITEIRQEQLNKLSDSLDNLSNGTHLLEVSNTFTFCMVSIDSFTNQKQSIFPLNKTAFEYTALVELQTKIEEVKGIMDHNQRASGLIEILQLKHIALKGLQKFIIDNI